MKPMTERDEKGRITHERLSDGDERWYDYDADGNIVLTRLSNGTEFRYDAAGNITHERLSDGDERWYDAAGNITKRKDRRREPMNTELQL